jgi:hypothetical protein
MLPEELWIISIAGIMIGFPFHIHLYRELLEQAWTQAQWKWTFGMYWLYL